MKLILAVVHDEDGVKLMEELNKNRDVYKRQIRHWGMAV